MSMTVTSALTIAKSEVSLIRFNSVVLSDGTIADQVRMTDGDWVGEIFRDPGTSVYRTGRGDVVREFTDYREALLFLLGH